MEHQKVLNLLNDANNSKFVTGKWNIVNDNSKENYDVGNKIIYNTEVLNLFRIGERGVGEAKWPPTSFSPVTSAKIGVSPQNLLTFGFNPFATLV